MVGVLTLWLLIEYTVESYRLERALDTVVQSRVTPLDIELKVDRRLLVVPCANGVDGEDTVESAVDIAVACIVCTRELTSLQAVETSSEYTQEERLVVALLNCVSAFVAELWQPLSLNVPLETQHVHTS